MQRAPLRREPGSNETSIHDSLAVHSGTDAAQAVPPDRRRAINSHII
jgi:hypothetical protein